ncbi:hypothetical protein QQ008_05480 [Fulvivirgaceae bacterium BMA10]|uniref:Uncharacterized protein n=1 Tax=Splendidivirga corallicola TaxID=3051826 RepID=A0ABT8KJB9_9BACT|nr:hypothetical protein [Fulvivirgaceae bacterium BMA10]
MIRRIILIGILCATMPIMSHAQKGDWVKGSVTFYDNKTFNALLKFERKPKGETLHVYDGKETMTFSSKDIISFSYFDKTVNNTRTFVSVPIRSDYKREAFNMFLEMCYQGSKVSVLSRTTTPLPGSPGGNHKRSNKKIKNYTYEALFLWDHENDIVENYSLPTMKVDKLDKLQMPNKHLVYSLAWDSRKDFKKFIKENRLSFYSKDDLISMIDHYNLSNQHLTTKAE